MKKMNFKQVFILVFKASKVVPAVLLIINILLSIIYSIQIIVLAEFLNSVLRIFDVNSKNISYIVLMIVIYVLLQLFLWLGPNISDLFYTHLLLKVRVYCSNLVLEKYSKIQYCHIEDKSTLDLMTRVVPNVEEKVVGCFQSYFKIISFIVKIAGLIIVLASQAVLPAVFIIACAVPLFYLAVKSGRTSYESAKGVSNLKRKAEYLSEIMLNRNYVYERKLFQYGQYINDQWRDDFELARILKLKTSTKWHIKNKIGSVLTSIIAAISALTLIESVLTSNMSVGLYISLVGSIYALVKVMAWEFMLNMDSLANTKEYIKEFITFCSLKDELPDNAYEQRLQKFESLEFENVSFKYPNTDTYILKNLCLRIDANKSYSIVGVNGAGKTTMVKLILGLFDDYEGKISINGKNIKEYSKKQVRSMCTAVFQDFAKYSLSIRDNICLGGLNNAEKIDDQNINQVVNDVGLKETIEQYKKGLDTFLGSNFKEGQDFSGGQWQRLAIARNLIGNSELTFFDEPTASLDPIMESQFYQSLQNISLKKTVVIISHRLAIAKNVDFIYVIDNGKVSEYGNFQELMAGNQGFAKMYNSQKEWYDEE